MAIKVELLFISGLIAAAAAYPYDLQAKAAGYTCNLNAVHTITLGLDKYDLHGCTASNGDLCIDGLPGKECSNPLSICSVYTWYSGDFMWTVDICRDVFDFLTGYCYHILNVKDCHDYSVNNGANGGKSEDGPGIPNCVCIDVPVVGKQCVPVGCDSSGISATTVGDPAPH